jgi:hypothetical protein
LAISKNNTVSFQKNKKLPPKAEKGAKGGISRNKFRLLV